MACVTLLSDFGLQDASVAVVKGTLLQHVPDAQIVDISHLVETFNIQQAAYLLLSAYRSFPKGTCHVLLFDIFSEQRPRLVLCEQDGQYLLAPDNGILALAFGDAINDVWCCHELDAHSVFEEWLQQVGRKVALLRTHTPSELGLPICALKVAPQSWLPKVAGDTVECHVIHIDRYENVVVNLSRAQFDAIGQGRPFRIQWIRGEDEITKLSTHFYEVSDSNMLCRFNATGYLEICVKRGKAASLFGFKLFAEKHFIYSSIKVYFG